MSTSKKKVLHTTVTVEYAMKWSDACIAHALGDSFTWTHRDGSSEEYSRSDVQHEPEFPNFIATTRKIEITGKIGKKKVVAKVMILGLEDLDDPRASIRMDDVSGPERILINYINVSIVERGVDAINLRFDVDSIPGLDQRQMVELAAA